MTVNEILREMRRLQRAGKGSQTVFQSCTSLSDTTVWCPRSEEVREYHSHVVLIPEKYANLREG